MAHDIEVATGSIGGHLDKLLVEELIEVAKASPKITVHNRHKISPRCITVSIAISTIGQRYHDLDLLAASRRTLY